MITKVMIVNEILEQALLYDFYGELLTDHQKEIYGQFVLEDLSLSEIAQSEGISRQILEGYESKLHLVEKFLSVKKMVQEINDVLDSYESRDVEPEVMAERIRRISDTIIEEL